MSEKSVLSMSLTDTSTEPSEECAELIAILRTIGVGAGDRH
jgi:hypothetical protein